VNVIRIKRIAAAALFVTLGIFCVLAALPYTVPRHEIRETVARALAAATGVTPDIGGAHLSFFPRPAARFDDIRFGGNGKDDLSAGSLRATIKLLPLLFGRAEVANLIFERAHLHFEAGPDGVRLLGLPLRPPSTAGEMTSSPKIRIADSVVDIRSSDGERTERLSGVDASLAWSGASLSMLASFQWRGMPSTLRIQIADAGALGENAKSAVRLRFEAEALRAVFDGEFAFRKGLQADGALSLESRSLRNMLATFGIEVPTRGGFGAFALKSRAQITPAALTVSKLSIELDGNRADGTLSLAIDSKRPVLQGTLAADTADFTSYMNGFSLISADKRDWSKEALDIKPLTGFDLDLRLSAGKVIFSNAEAFKVALAASVKEGRFTLSAGEGQIFGGILSGTAAIGPAPAGTNVRINASIKNFNSTQGIGALTGNRNLEGTGSFTLALSGSGASVSAITHDLKGDAELSVLDGALQGVNIEGALRTLAKKPLAAVSDLRGGRTPFDRFIAKLAINDGNAAFERAQIESGSVTVTLHGRASIPERDLNLRGVASLVSPPDANNISLPFLVRGSWDSPRVSPDGPAMLRHSSLPAGLRAALP
jgi:AsmA protein